MTLRTDSGRHINVQELVESAPVTRFHLRVLAICFVTAVIDGLDNQVIGVSASSISKDLSIPLSAFGSVFAAGVVGGLVGAMTLGSLADRFGRRPMLLFCTAVFSVFTFLTGFSQTLSELLVFRVLAGLGLGGAMPGFLSLASDYAPKSRRALATGLLWCGYPAGGVAGGLVGSRVISTYGWQTMFFVGASLGFFVLLLQFLGLPESLQYLARKGGKEPQIKQIAERIAPAVEFTRDTFCVDSITKSASLPLREVFACGRAVPTALIWAILFCTFLVSNFFVAWTPALLKTSGFSVSSAALMLSLWNLACIPSQATTGYLVDRVGPFRLLPLSYGALGIALGCLGLFLNSISIVSILMMVCGFLLGPAIAGMLFVTTALYPSAIRSTGVGWALGIGRSGQVFGSLLVGWLVAAGIRPGHVVLWIASAPLFAFVAVCLLASRRTKRHERGHLATNPSKPQAVG